MYLNIWQIAIIFAYVLAIALFESAIIFALIVLLSLVFPTRRFKDQFIAQSCIVVLLITVVALLAQQNINQVYRFSVRQLVVYPLVVLAALLLLLYLFSFIFERFVGLRRFLDRIADRMTIFSYIYIPLSLLGLVVVLLRNVF